MPLNLSDPRDPESASRTQLLQKVHGFQTTLTHALSKGYKQPKIPTWWTSFEEGTYKDFVAQYKRKVRIAEIFNNLLDISYADYYISGKYRFTRISRQESRSFDKFISFTMVTGHESFGLFDGEENKVASGEYVKEARQLQVSEHFIVRADDC